MSSERVASLPASLTATCRNCDASRRQTKLSSGKWKCGVCHDVYPSSEAGGVDSAE